MARMIVAGTRAGLTAEQAMHWPLDLVVECIHAAANLGREQEPVPLTAQDDRATFEALKQREFNGD